MLLAGRGALVVVADERDGGALPVVQRGPHFVERGVRHAQARVPEVALDVRSRSASTRLA